MRRSITVTRQYSRPLSSQSVSVWSVTFEEGITAEGGQVGLVSPLLFIKHLERRPRKVETSSDW